MPHHLPFGPDALTFDPGLIVETHRLDGALALVTSGVWQTAPLTGAGRAYVPPRVDLAWEVRRSGGSEASALVLKLAAHGGLRGLVSAAPERATLGRRDRLVVVMVDLVMAVRGAEERLAFGYLADALLGTRPVRRSRPAAESREDLAALSSLVP